MTTTYREVDRTYEVPVGFVLPDLAGVTGVAELGQPAEQHLDAIYYDTPGLRLAAHRVTLRRHAGGGDDAWHLDRPENAVAGGETTLPVIEHVLDVPPALAVQVRALSRGEELRPIARLRTTRVQRPACDASGVVLARVADDVISREALNGTLVVEQWRELELELVDGPRKLLDALDAALRAAGAKPTRSPSELALALAGQPGPVDASRTRREHALTQYLRKQRDTIVRTDPGVRGGDPDSVHDMRTATRRLRATLRTYRPVLGLPDTRRVSEDLRWLGVTLGAARDGDVTSRRLARAIAAEPIELVIGPIAMRISERLTAETVRARRALTEALDSDRYTALLDALDGLLEVAMPNKVSDRQLRGRAGKALRRAERRLDDAARAQPGTTGVPLPLPRTGARDVQLHQARKAYKRARYAVEAVVPIAGKPAARLGKRLATIQDVLGDHQDSVVAEQLLRDYGMRAQLDGDNAFTYGLLYARQDQAGQRVLDKLARVRQRTQGRKVRGWLHS